MPRRPLGWGSVCPMIVQETSWPRMAGRRDAAGRPSGFSAWLEATRAAVSKVKQHNHDTLEVSTGSSKSSFGECFAMPMGRRPRICDAWTARMRRGHVGKVSAWFATRQPLGRSSRTNGSPLLQNSMRDPDPMWEPARILSIERGAPFEIIEACRRGRLSRTGSPASASTSASVKPWSYRPDNRCECLDTLLSFY